MAPPPPEPPTLRPRPATVATLAFALLLAACGGSDVDSDAAPTSVLVTTTPSTAPTSTDETDAAGQDGSSTTATTSEETTTTGAPVSGWTVATYTLTRVARLDAPMALAVRSGDDDLWVAERDGRVQRLIRSTATDDRNIYEPDGEPALDITNLVGTAGEGGLLGLTFSPDGGHLVVSYTDRDGDSVLTEYPVTDGPSGPSIDGTGERVLLRLDQPYSNHNGGQVTTGPDGLLYVGLGDGGSGGDPQNNGQDTTTLLGAILRIDPERPAGESPYGIPADNPFADGEDGRPEIWLWGVRNPWRFSFDRDTDDLWIGDVGQNAIEEIDHLPAVGGLAGRGANLGWRVFEGDEVFDPDATPPTDTVGPVYTYRHENGRCSVTGGHVYRGDRLPALDGVYLFGDYCSGELFGLQSVADGVLVSNLVTDEPVGNLISFGEGPDGELYVLAGDGSIHLLGGTGQNE